MTDPTPVHNTSPSSSTEILDNENEDPSYGLHKKPKHSMRLGCRPSSARIAAQKLITKTKGVKLSSTKPSSNKNSMVKNQMGVQSTSSKQEPSRNMAKQDDPIMALKTTTTSKQFGLKITHHGLVKHRVEKKGRRCICDMCGEKFKNSTSYIEHYSSTHLNLNCKYCEKCYTNPLSLQKHQYVHTTPAKKCGTCGKSFPFSSQLANHRKTHMKVKPHICSHPGYGKDFIHRYDLLKHEGTHSKKKLKCTSCEYSINDIWNLKQHSRTHSDETYYECKKCHKNFKFYMQKKWHRC